MTIITIVVNREKSQKSKSNVNLRKTCVALIVRIQKRVECEGVQGAGDIERGEQRHLMRDDINGHDKEQKTIIEKKRKQKVRN